MKSSFLQSGLWASFKAAFGWKPYTFDFKGNSITVLVRRFLKKFSLAYIPYAPDTDTDIQELSLFLKKRLPKDVIFIRYDLPWFVKEEGRWSDSSDTPKHFYKASLDIQPPSSVILDLTQTEDEILRGMKERSRRNIKTAAKKNVVVTRHAGDDLKIWYELYKETSERDKIAIHPFDYYQHLFMLAAEQDDIDVRLYLASVDGDVIAGIITLFYGKQAVYLYGASCGRKRETMPAYALQWQAIRDAKNAGCEYYDFYGCPPNDDPNHPMHGLFLFKTGFSPNLVHHPGAWDYPCHGMIYHLYRIAEAMRKFYYKKLKKR